MFRMMEDGLGCHVLPGAVVIMNRCGLGLSVLFHFNTSALSFLNMFRFYYEMRDQFCLWCCWR